MDVSEFINHFLYEQIFFSKNSIEISTKGKLSAHVILHLISGLISWNLTMIMISLYILNKHENERKAHEFLIDEHTDMCYLALVKKYEEKQVHRLKML